MFRLTIGRSGFSIRKIMNAKFFFRFGIVASALALWACAVYTASEQNPPETAPVTQPNANALDEIALSDISTSIGPIKFEHKKHYTSKSDGGRGVACADCHHDYKPDGKTVPGSCRKCHYQAHSERGPGGITL
jgi:hypothetical protein